MIVPRPGARCNTYRQICRPLELPHIEAAKEQRTKKAHDLQSISPFRQPFPTPCTVGKPLALL